MAEVPVGCSTLPPHVLAHILSYVPLDARMRGCACVNSAWHTAAVQASQSMAVKGLTTPRGAGLAAWLRKYSTAAQVSRLELQVDNTSTIDESTSAAVGLALPALEQLQSLHLRRGWRAAAVAQLSSLHKLQELDLSCHSSVLRAAAATAPTGLTSLVLNRCIYSAQLQEGESPESTTSAQTAWASLPKLQKLELRASVCISFPAVARLPELRTCIISCASIAAHGEGPTRLSALSALTRLQHLDLAGWLMPTGKDELPVLDASDCAALTASTQLTFLSVHRWQLQPELCSAAFPPERQLPLLQELHLGPCFMDTPAATAKVVSAAPSLAVLKVGCSNYSFHSEEDYREEVAHTVGLDGMQLLQKLKCVALDGARVEDSSIWDVLAQMTQLTELIVKQVSIPCLPGILQLTALTGLSSLFIDVVFLDEDEDEGGYCWSNCMLSGTTTPVYLQLPAALITCTAQLCNMANEYEVHSATPLLLEAADALCPAAQELFWSSEPQWQGVQDSNEKYKSSLFECVDSAQPLFDQMEQSQAQLLELTSRLPAALAAECNLQVPLQQAQAQLLDLLNSRLPAALAATCDLQAPQPQQQAGVVLGDGDSHTSVSMDLDDDFGATGDNTQGLGAVRSGWEAFKSRLMKSVGADSTPFARESKRLLAAVQDLKEEIRQMREQHTDESSDDLSDDE